MSQSPKVMCLACKAIVTQDQLALHVQEVHKTDTAPFKYLPDANDGILVTCFSWSGKFLKIMLMTFLAVAALVMFLTFGIPFVKTTVGFLLRSTKGFAPLVEKAVDVFHLSLENALVQAE
jgi:hypothetical protein